MPGVERVLEKERALGSSIRFEDVLDEVAGVYPLVIRDEQMDAGSCGMVAGLIRDIPTVQGLINRIMRQAEDIICERPDEPVNRGGAPTSWRCRFVAKTGLTSGAALRLPPRLASEAIFN